MELEGIPIQSLPQNRGFRDFIKKQYNVRKQEKVGTLAVAKVSSLVSWYLETTLLPSLSRIQTPLIVCKLGGTDMILQGIVFVIKNTDAFNRV